MGPERFCLPTIDGESKSFRGSRANTRTSRPPGKSRSTFVRAPTEQMRL